MNLTGIISISGRPGLFKVIVQGKNNVIVESLVDKKRFPAYSSDRISALEDISIYTHDQEKPLREIFKSIFEKVNGAETISHKDSDVNLINYLLDILPNYDKERVYVSDIKKIFQWYNLLHKSGNLKLKEEEKVTEVVEDSIEVEKKVKKSTSKKVEEVENKSVPEKKVKKVTSKVKEVNSK